MKLDVLNLRNYIQTPESGNVRNNVSNTINNSAMTVPTQIESQRPEKEIPSNDSQKAEAKAAEALKAQTLAQAPVSYKYIRDIKLPFSAPAKLYKLSNGQKVAILEKKVQQFFKRTTT